jgi:hypothetical protein
LLINQILTGCAVCPAPLAIDAASPPESIMPGGVVATEAEIEAHK